jgi:hypothetical protein
MERVRPVRVGLPIHPFLGAQNLLSHHFVSDHFTIKHLHRLSLAGEREQRSHSSSSIIESLIR